MCVCLRVYVGGGGVGVVGVDAIHFENKMSPPVDGSEWGKSAAALALQG